MRTFLLGKTAFRARSAFAFGQRYAILNLSIVFQR